MILCSEHTKKINDLKLKRNKAKLWSDLELRLSMSIGFIASMRVSSQHEFKFIQGPDYLFDFYCIHCKCEKQFYHDTPKKLRK